MPNKKQNSDLLYKFVIVMQNGESMESEFKSNSELFRLIIDSGACNDRYKREFKINKILK